MARGRRKQPVEQRFFEKVQKTPSGDWIWVGAKNQTGYGVFYDENERTVYAHRWAYRRFVGPIPTGGLVRHTCDISSCVNPGHLVTGSAVDNARDSVSRGRHVHARKTHCCPSGHPYDQVSSVGQQRVCSRCVRRHNLLRRRATSSGTSTAGQLTLDF